MRRSALAALAIAGCSSTAQPTTISMHEPSAAAAFMGWTLQKPRSAYPLPQPYLAIANARSDDLRLVDLAIQKPLMSPGYAFPLSIPTLARPTYLAAGSLRDGGADLLAVAGVGAVVDVVSTWEDGSTPSGSRGSRVVAQYDLSGIAGAGAEILCMAATAVPGAPAGTPPTAPAQPGRAWLILGFSGSSAAVGGIPAGVGKLVVLEFVRGADGSVELGAPVQAKPLQFDPVSLAVAPDLFHLYVATPGLITDFTTFPPAAGARQVQGVAEVDMSGGAGAPWQVRGLDARAPTTLVAAAILGERVSDDPNLYGPPVLRVYAAIDSSGCGPQQPSDCGIAVIDPSLGGLAADLAPPGTVVPAQPYRAPIQVGATPLALSVASPPASGPLQCISDNDPCNASTGPNQQPLMRLLRNGTRWTPALGVVGAADGRSYILDLGRSGPASDFTMLNAETTRAAVTSAQSLVPVLPDGTTAKAGLGLYQQYPTASQTFTNDPTRMTQAIVITPGFTRGETWSLVWQGKLPSLQGADFVLGLENGDPNTLYLAFQAAMGGQWDPGARVADPALAIHPADAWPAGDIAQFTLSTDQFGAGGNPCALASGTSYEAVVTSMLPATPDHPAGALQLALPASPAADVFRVLCLRDWLAAAGAGAYLAGTDGAVRASGLVLIGSATGYAGRPPLLTKADLDAGLQDSKRFNLGWQDESTLSGEALVLARKARRFFYPNDSFNFQPGATSPYPESGDNPMTPGVVIGLIAGPMCTDEPPGSHRTAICPADRMGDLARDATVLFTTRSGLQASYQAAVPSSLPSWAIAFDRSYFPDGGNDGSVFYVTYRQDALVVVIPGQTPNISTTLR